MQKSKVFNTNHTNSPLTSFDKVSKYFKFRVDTYIYLANGSHLQPLHSITYNRRATVSPKDESFQLGNTTEYCASHEGLCTPHSFPWAVSTFIFVRSPLAFTLWCMIRYSQPALFKSSVCYSLTNANYATHAANKQTWNKIPEKNYDKVLTKGVFAYPCLSISLIHLSVLLLQ